MFAHASFADCKTAKKKHYKVQAECLAHLKGEFDLLPRICDVETDGCPILAGHC
jgi:hypothetical protein